MKSIPEKMASGEKITAADVQKLFETMDKIRGVKNGENAKGERQEGRA